MGFALCHSRWCGAGCSVATHLVRRTGPNLVHRRKQHSSITLYENDINRLTWRDPCEKSVYGTAINQASVHQASGLSSNKSNFLLLGPIVGDVCWSSKFPMLTSCVADNAGILIGSFQVGLSSQIGQCFDLEVTLVVGGSSVFPTLLLYLTQWNLTWFYVVLWQSKFQEHRCLSLPLSAAGPS